MCLSFLFALCESLPRVSGPLSGVLFGAVGRREGGREGGGEGGQQVSKKRVRMARTRPRERRACWRREATWEKTASSMVDLKRGREKEEEEEGKGGGLG